MSEIQFSNAEKDLLTDKIQAYLKKEFDYELGQFDTEFFLDFISKEIGAYYYNLGLSDARAILDNSIENITEAIYEIEQPTQFIR